jgi:hypothetical protein
MEYEEEHHNSNSNVHPHTLRERLSAAANKAKGYANKARGYANSPYAQRAHTVLKMAVPQLAAAEYAAKKSLSAAGSVAARVAAAKARGEAALGMTANNLAKRSARIAEEVQARRAAGITSNNFSGGIDPTGKNINKLSGFANIGSPVSSLGSPVTPEGKGGRKRTHKQRKNKRATRKNKLRKSKTRKH